MKKESEKLERKFETEFDEYYNQAIESFGMGIYLRRVPTRCQTGLEIQGMLIASDFDYSTLFH